LTIKNEYAAASSVIVAHKVQEDVSPKSKTAQQAAVDAAQGFKPTSSHVKTVAQRALPMRILRVLGQYSRLTQ
jgi:hypothetical protein